MTQSNTTRIARNTIFLYFRMLVIMGVNFYTVRIVLDVLGAEDYGIYHVIGGVVAMFSFLNSTLASSSQRFFSYELGQGKFQRLKEVFSLNITLLLLFILVLLVIAETFGLWLINTQLVIPANRMDAVNWIYQFSIFSFVASVLTVPYQGLIIAHEKMNAFAYISIAEAVVKLFIVFVLMFIPFDRLKLYAVLLFGASAVIAFLYYFYCRRNFSESRFRFFWDKERVVELFSYSGWHFMGSVSVVVQNQGINILLNMFFNPVVNAARAIAYQVNAAINALSANFFVAVKPQIYKSHSTGDLSGMNTLVYQSSKFCYYLILFLAIPIYLEVPYILHLWLKDVPDFTVVFTRLIIINALIDSLSNPMIAAALATNRIKKFELITGGLITLSLPASYLFLKLGFNPDVTVMVCITIAFILVWVRAYLLKGLVQLSLVTYFLKVILPIVKVTLFSCIVPCFVHLYLEENLWRLLSVGIISFFSVFLSAYFILPSDHRKLIVHYVYNRLKKK